MTGLLKTIRHKFSNISIGSSDDDKPSKQSQSLLAQSTIMTMLSLLNHDAPFREIDMQLVEDAQQQELRLLSALVTVIIRKDEVIAVVVKSHNRLGQLELLASTHQTKGKKQDSAPV